MILHVASYLIVLWVGIIIGILLEGYWHGCHIWMKVGYIAGRGWHKTFGDKK